MKHLRCKLLSLLLQITTGTYAQKIYIADVGIALRQFERVPGKFPTDLLNQLHHPSSFIGTLQAVHQEPWSEIGLSRGAPGNTPIFVFATVGWKFQTARAGTFWRNATLITGIQISNRLSTEAGNAYKKLYYLNTISDTTFFHVSYHLQKNYQMTGLHAGINYLFPLSKKWNTSISLLLQKNKSRFHYYAQNLDSSYIFINNHSTYQRTRLSDLAGNPIQELSILLPIGFEYQLFSTPLFFKAELNPGVQLTIVSQQETFSECLGWGAALIYRPQRK